MFVKHGQGQGPSTIIWGGFGHTGWGGGCQAGTHNDPGVRVGGKTVGFQPLVMSFCAFGRAPHPLALGEECGMWVPPCLLSRCPGNPSPGEGRPHLKIQPAPRPPGKSLPPPPRPLPLSPPPLLRPPLVGMPPGGFLKTPKTAFPSREGPYETGTPHHRQPAPFGKRKTLFNSILEFA